MSPISKPLLHENKINYTELVPADVLKLIFQQLHAPVVRACRLVNKRWRVIVESLVREKLPAAVKNDFKPLLEQMSSFKIQRYSQLSGLRNVFVKNLCFNPPKRRTLLLVQLVESL